ncbi:MAG TPA: RDD family protein [Verrucomicrobiae bacterium]|nr:RDD family protein [Verrucomicrobiae bacterium]
MEIALHRNPYSGFWRRVIAILIDWVLLCVFAWPIVKAMISLLPADPLRPVIYGVNVLFAWIYFSSFESSTIQATPGKFLLNIRVTDMQWKRINFLRATIRHFGKVVSALPLGIGFLSAASTTGKRQALHDGIAGTLVIRKNFLMNAPPEKST